MSILMSCSRFILRAVERMVSVDMPERSSMNMGRDWRRFAASLSAVKSSCDFIFPVRMRHASRRDSVARRRSMSWEVLISSENMPTGVFCLSAERRAMSRARDVFPTLGRAARMMRSDGWRPESALSILS